MKQTKNSTVKIDNKATHLKFFSVSIIILIIALIGRLFYIQFIDSTRLKELAYKQTTSSSIISPQRGVIYDSTGKTLAISVQVDTVSVNPSLISVENDTEATKVLKEKVARAFSNILDLDYDETLVKLTSVNSTEVIARKVETDKIDSLKKWMKENKTSSGINIDEDTKRSYPYDNLASTLLGFCGSDNNGLAGLEYYWDETLTGTPGRVITSIDASQDTIPDNNETYVSAKNGNNITLSIDANVQTIAEKYLKQACDENNCKNGGCIILMDPTTGDILAMATYPDYNLNKPFEPNDYLSKNWENLTSEQKTNSLYEMYRNKAVSSTYEPGSVFKIIAASTALEENIVETDTPGDFYCSGKEKVADSTIYCANNYGHKSESLRQALENSCNPALIQLTKRIGATTFYKYIEAFGFFDKTGIQTAGESSSVFHKLSNVGPVELATTSFGQRFEITPLQMITAACSIANKGTLVQPRIVTKIENPDTNVVTNIDVKTVRQVISGETAAKVCNIMESVVTDGGGQAGAVVGYSIGGKTGTSEPNSTQASDDYTASFLAIAPVENTKVVALLTLYGPRGDSHYGGKIAAPVVSQVLSEVLPYLGIPSNDASESTPNNSITLPDLRTKTVSEAENILHDLGLTYKTSSNPEDVVTSQMPKAGTSLLSGGIIRLYSENKDTTVSTTVPDLKGKSLTNATSSLKSKNLNIQYTGSGTVVSQDISAGTSVEEGTIVRVSLKEVTADQH